MRVLLNIALVCLAFSVLAAIVAVSWFRFYTRDLPDVERIAQFAPAKARQVADSCRTTTSIAVPYAAIGSNLRAALSAEGVKETETGKATLALQISRSMFCAPSKELKRHVDEFRIAKQLERRFSTRELFTICANRAYFGENVFGVEEASDHFFGTGARDLTIAQAALLAGLIRSPSVYSPITHPDRALQRRNEVVDAMIASGSISQLEGDDAKSEVMGVAAPRVR